MAKLLNFILVFILSLANFVVMLSPLAIIILPFFYFFKKQTMLIGMDVALFFAFCICSYMLLYLLLDSLFGFTVRNYVKRTIHYKDAGFLNGHEDIVTAFTYLKKRFNLPNVELYISQDMHINAYAVGSMRKKAVVMTLGLIQRMYNQSQGPDNYIDAVKGILGHEMSHLINKDFLPGVLVYSNEVAHRFIAKIMHGIFIVIARILWVIPGVGKVFATLSIQIYSGVYMLSGLFFRLFFKPVYGFLYKAFSRSIEYRCDKDSAKIFGGRVMAHALSLLGKGAYFSIFSTHPRTKARIAHVQHVHPQPGTITPSILSTASNILAITALVAVAYYLSTQIHFTQLEPQFIAPLQRRVMNMYHFLMTGSWY